MKKSFTEVRAVNEELLSILTPIGVAIRNNTITIGESIAKIYGIIKYPAKADIGWLSKLTNIPSTICSMTFSPIDNAVFIESLSSFITQQRGLARSSKNVLEQSKAERSAEDAVRIMENIDRDGETVGEISISLAALSRDEKNADKIYRKVESIAAVNKCKLRNLSSLQKQGFQQIAPYYTTNKEVGMITNRIMPISTFVGGFPFSASGFNDGAGYYFGKDAAGGLVVVDPWVRGNDRTNSNFVVMGVPGVGKSTAVKNIMISEFTQGTKIIVIDPEREYKSLCENLGGDWINCGMSNASGRINPLQIRPAPTEEDGERDELYGDDRALGDMVLHIKHLEIFFSLYIPSLGDIQRSLLKDCLVELYSQFGIEWTTDIKTLTAEQFPVFRDLYDLIVRKQAQEKETNPETAQNLMSLAALLKDIAYGSDSFLWNGHSTITAQTQFVCLDTHELQDLGDNIKRTQYFNMLSWCWEQMSRDRTEKVLLVCDEAYLMIDPNVPQSLIFLRNVAKRARKYEAGIAIISHSVVDFLHESIKMYAQALLDSPCYKLLMGCDGKNLEETTDLFGLTEAEQELLLSKKRGVALSFFGAKRLAVTFDIPAYKLELMGSSGGR